MICVLIYLGKVHEVLHGIKKRSMVKFKNACLYEYAVQVQRQEKVEDSRKALKIIDRNKRLFYQDQGRQVSPRSRIKQGQGVRPSRS